jgi:hypothetical protein
MRTKQPYTLCLPVCINVLIDENEMFDIAKLLKGEYTIHLLGGQHIVEADFRLLSSVYKSKKPAEVPSGMIYKQAELYLNCDATEEALLVNVHNQQLNLKNQFFDRVLQITLFLFHCVRLSFQYVRNLFSPFFLIRW